MTPGSDRRLSSEQTLQPTELQPHDAADYSSPHGTDGPAPGPRPLPPAGGHPLDRTEPPCLFCHDSGKVVAWFLADGVWTERLGPCSCVELEP
jgi:hypothetical protein